MLSLTIGGKAFRIDPTNPLGQGGEACVYDLGDGRVVKVFRPPSDPTFALDPSAKAAAKKRIDQHQKKLGTFPANVPARVVAPHELAMEKNRIVGYAMPFLKGGEVMLRYSQPRFRQTIPQAAVLPILRDLHATVTAMHPAGLVIGDFNDSNVLVLGEQAYLIDADSMQWGPWLCATYTTRFVDPLCCEADPTTGEPVFVRPHSTDSDWYAFSAMVFHTFAWTDVYGGTYVAPPGGPKVKHGARPMHRIPAWHKDVRYPRPAFPLGNLPDDIMQHFHRVFEKDARGPFPATLLERMRWTTCSTCGTEHARAQCPKVGCATLAPAVKPIVQTTQVRGNVKATTVYQAGGTILRAEAHSGRVMWLAYQGGKFMREDGTTVLSGQIDRRMRTRLKHGSTFLSLHGQIAHIHHGPPPHPVGSFSVRLTEGVPVFATNEHHVYWCEGDGIARDGKSALLGGAVIGQVLGGQTRFWVGNKFGFGFYRAGSLTVAFVFNAEHTGLNDRVDLQIRGKLLDATCTIAGDRAWFFTTTQEAARTVNRCHVVSVLGKVEAVAEADAGDGSWLGSIRGGAASSSGMLLMPTDDGLTRVEVVGNSITPTRVFPDTAPWVDVGCQILLGHDGLYVVSADSKTIHRLVIS